MRLVKVLAAYGVRGDRPSQAKLENPLQRAQRGLRDQGLGKLLLITSILKMRTSQTRLLASAAAVSVSVPHRFAHAHAVVARLRSLRGDHHVETRTESIPPE